MNIVLLLTEAEIPAEFAESIEARDLPEKFFYWTPQSVKAWEDVSAESAESVQSTWESLAVRAADLTKVFNGPVPVISFGAGDAQKDRILLRALAAAGREVRYFPVDASQQLLETACAGAEDDDCEVLGIKADISSPMHMVLAADVSEAPRLFLMVGSTLGGFDPMDQIRHVADCVKKGDILIIDAHLHPGTPDLVSDAQKRFVFAPFASAGVLADDGEIEFSERPDDRLDGMFMLTRRFMASRDLRLLVAGSEFSVARGERILLNFRYLFTPEAFRWLLTGHAGLRIVGEIPCSDGKTLTAVCIKG